MTLDDWLWKKRIKQSEFARLIGISESLLSRLMSGSRTLTPEVEAKIVRATRGQVTRIRKRAA